jgi:hypothetical protein
MRKNMFFFYKGKGGLGEAIKQPQCLGKTRGLNKELYQSCTALLCS